jgi:hypothetical protein
VCGSGEGDGGHHGDHREDGGAPSPGRDSTTASAASTTRPGDESAPTLPCRRRGRAISLADAGPPPVRLSNAPVCAAKIWPSYGGGVFGAVPDYEPPGLQLLVTAEPCRVRTTASRLVEPPESPPPTRSLRPPGPDLNPPPFKAVSPDGWAIATSSCNNGVGWTSKGGGDGN